MYGVSSSFSTFDPHDGHFVGGSIGFAPLRPLLWHCFDDVRNHFARTLDDDRVAQMQIEPLDLVDVVQRDVRHRHAADEHRLELANRREIAALAHLPADILQHRRLLLGFVLVGDRPTAGLCSWRRVVALRERIDLHTMPSVMYGSFGRIFSNS